MAQNKAIRPSKGQKEKLLIERLMGKAVVPVKWIEPTETSATQTPKPTKKSNDPIAGFDLEDY